ncbi:MAG: GNAT family N-acetyltransferase, partial [Nitrososphaerales archaeon]
PSRLRFTMRDIAGVYFVSTLPEFRRHGFGEAMTWRAAVDGRREGCTTSCLQASEMGRPLYERMGYRTIVEYQVWRGQTESHS